MQSLLRPHLEVVESLSASSREKVLVTPGRNSVLQACRSQANEAFKFYSKIQVDVSVLNESSTLSLRSYGAGGVKVVIWNSVIIAFSKSGLGTANTGGHDFCNSSQANF